MEESDLEEGFCLSKINKNKDPIADAMTDTIDLIS